ncbi:radical SAM protein [Spirosoma spitsbergense]|uniref:radical SAM protein n=1 Tax=Spirosoma spitsbergense TaxID=431554 RepID=UPI0003799D7B|nr:radical SAM protein [Spirosoma spitsbergense]
MVIKGAIVKVASRCNLNCTYCFMYHAGDDSYQRQPKRMTALVRDALLQRVLEHCNRYGLKTFDFILHGGEPLLAGKRFFEQFVAQAIARLTPAVEPRFFIQTNGLLLDEAWCRHLGRLGIRVGISLDGPASVNDRYRTDHRGQSSFLAVERGLRYALQSDWLVNHPGVLTVIDPTTNPVAVYEYFRSVGVRELDFLFPDATFDRPPYQPATSDTPYADWLITVFDQWFMTKNKPRIRLFEQLIALILGQDVQSERWGMGTNEFMVVETNGEIEPSDMLKICGPDFTKTGVNVCTHALVDALDHSLIALHRNSHQTLSRICQKCPVVAVCGGGLLAHRYSARKGFDNPSVYCRDLLKLITHTQSRVIAFLPVAIRQEADLAPLSYDDALAAVQAVQMNGYCKGDNVK